MGPTDPCTVLVCGRHASVSVSGNTDGSDAGAAVHMDRFQEGCEARAKAWAAAELERFKARALEDMRQAERTRYREKLADMRKELDDAATAREREMERRARESEAALRAKHEAVDKAAFEARQRVLALMDRTAAHDAEVKRQAALHARTKRMHDEAAHHAAEQMAMREAAVEGLSAWVSCAWVGVCVCVE